MQYTITINQQTPEALAFVNYAKKLGFKVTKQETKTTDLAKPTLTPQQQQFKKMFKQGLKEMEAIRTGKMKAGKLEDLLNEI